MERATRPTIKNYSVLRFLSSIKRTVEAREKDLGAVRGTHTYRSRKTERERLEPENVFNLSDFCMMLLLLITGNCSERQKKEKKKKKLTSKIKTSEKGKFGYKTISDMS